MTHTTAAIDAATAEVFRRCNGDHNQECAWHAVMENVENGSEELVENALAIIDDNCQC
jgi:hypothetical protein